VLEFVLEQTDSRRGRRGTDRRAELKNGATRFYWCR